jgi:Icc-related predicted phosphoesterase
MQCVAVSDFHMCDVDTPPADLLIVGGDMTYKGTPYELEWFTKWLDRQPQKHKVWIAGNHELGLEDAPDAAQRIAQETNSIYLNDSATEIEGVTIFGSPITPWFFDWAFNRHRGKDIQKHWDKIPEGLDILVTHGPPFGFLDMTPRNGRVGCGQLLETLEGLMQPPRFHIFGHIHAGYGRDTLTRKDGQVVELMNVSICDEQYKAVNAPIVFEIKKGRQEHCASIGQDG